MRRVLLAAVFLWVAWAVAAQAAPPRPRPYSGVGVLVMTPEPVPAAARLVLYREPGVERIAEVDAGSLPRLAGSAEEPLLAVAGRRGGWMRVVYDDAGREAWIESKRRWEYLPWPEFLAGRAVQVLPGLKKGFYLVRGEPVDGAPEAATVGRDQELRVLRVEGDWARIQAPAGWFRWRDGDGRLTVTPAR